MTTKQLLTDQTALAEHLAESLLSETRNMEHARSGISGAFMCALRVHLETFRKTPLAEFIEVARPILELRLPKPVVRVYLSQAAGLAAAIDAGYIVGTAKAPSGEKTVPASHMWDGASLKREYDNSRTPNQAREPRAKEEARQEAKSGAIVIPHDLDAVIGLAHEFSTALLKRLSCVSAGPAVELVKAAHAMQRATKPRPTLRAVS